MCKIGTWVQLGLVAKAHQAYSLDDGSLTAEHQGSVQFLFRTPYIRYFYRCTLTECCVQSLHSFTGIAVKSSASSGIGKHFILITIDPLPSSIAQLSWGRVTLSTLVTLVSLALHCVWRHTMPVESTGAYISPPTVLSLCHFSYVALPPGLSVWVALRLYEYYTKYALYLPGYQAQPPLLQ